jgi:CRP-like cAMP-binding protein
MITKEKALEVARSAGWLSEQSPALQDDLLARCILRTYSEKETICNVGDPHHGLYALVSGVLRVELSTMGEDYRIASVKQPVFWFGEAASLARSSFYVTITAATPASLLFLPHHDFERLIENAAYCRALSVLLIGHIEEALQVIAQMLEGDVENRIAARVALLAERSGPQQPHVIPVTQSDLAEMCGLSRPTVQQVLSNLERRGLIRAGYRRIEVIDLEALVNCSKAASKHPSFPGPSTTAKSQG